jgi:hypothetical protein
LRFLLIANLFNCGEHLKILSSLYYRDAPIAGLSKTHL